MPGGRWRRFSYQGVRFDVLEGRFIRIRCRQLDQPERHAYLIVDILTLKPNPEPVYEPATVRRLRGATAAAD